MVHDLLPQSTFMIRGILNMLRPHRMEGAEKIRLGRFYDGGYVMLDRFKGISAAYSLGINDDVSWDLDFARRNVPVYQYDHTIDALPIKHPLFHWERKGIGARTDTKNSLETLPDLIKKNGHEGNQDLILKCDIEGAEWEVFSAIPNATVRQFRQIVLEMHGFGNIRDMNFANQARAALENITLSHKVVHVHANNFAPFAVVGGVPVPEVLELTFVRSDLGTFAPSDEIFPTPLDMPCHSREADLYLGKFAFD